MNDEQFASDLRPDSIFGVGGTSDYFNDEEYDDYEDEYPAPTQSEAGYQAQPTFDAVGSSPMAVAEALPAPTPNGKLGAAITLFLVLGGAGVGWYFGKFKGAAGGALVGGALRNFYRAKQGLSEGGDPMGAVKSGIVGTVGAAGGGYLLWTANRK